MKNTDSEQGSDNIPRIKKIENYLFRRYDVRINIITNTIEKRAIKTADPFEPINESDLRYELFNAGYTRFDGELKALLGSSVILKYDPFKAYFEGLKPRQDNEPDYIQILSTYVDVKDRQWFETMFKKMLVRTVSQSLGTPQFNKHCFTFVGNQHDGKTSFFDFLVPPKLINYYKKGYDFHGGRQAKFSLVQNFMVNLDELAQFDKKDLNNEFKATLSENYVKYAPLFSSTEVSFARRASFVASTNKSDFLTDATGSVRWIVFQVMKINHDNGGSKGYSQNVDIDKVWAQAYALHQSGFKAELTHDEIKQNELFNRQFMRVTTEMELVARHFEKADKNQYGAQFHTASSIEKLLREKGYPKLYQNQIGAAMQILGFQQIANWNAKLKYSEKGYYLLETSI